MFIEQLSTYAAVLAAVSALLPILFGLVLAIARLSLGMVTHRAEQVAWAALALAAVASVLQVAAAAAGTFRPDAVSLVYFDAISATMLMLVTFLGAIVLRYSRNHMAGDAGQVRFFKWLSLTIGSVLVVVVSGNLGLFFLGWLATSLALHQLLVFYPQRPGARFAARKKFLISRIGDVCLLGAIGLIWASFGTLEFGKLFAAVPEATGWTAHAIALLLVAGALLKSAQFPFHSWLPDTMETPTPVSALMHAGIINGGGFLVIRLSELIVPSQAALHVLLGIGVLTALFASIVMLTQTSAKRSLAYSTIAQMGFMMFQCGLALFPLAMLHIVAHALYKAHAFLSAGSVVETAKSSWSAKAAARPHPILMTVALLLVTAGTIATAAVFGFSLTEDTGVVILGVVLMFGITHLLSNAFAAPLNVGVVVRSVGLAALVCAAYFLLHEGSVLLFAGSVAAAPAPDALGLWMMSAVVVLFAAVLIFQAATPYQKRHRFWQAAYVHASNGFYIGTIANRWMRSLEPKSPAA